MGLGWDGAGGGGDECVMMCGTLLGIWCRGWNARRTKGC